MASVSIVVDSESLGTVEVSQSSAVAFYDSQHELREIKDLLEKATTNIYGAYGIEKPETD